MLLHIVLIDVAIIVALLVLRTIGYGLVLGGFAAWGIGGWITKQFQGGGP